MKTFRLIAVLAFAAIFAISAFAQAPTTPANFRIAVINTAAFDDDKAGLTRYVTAANSLDNEFKPMQAELQTMATKLQALQTEIAKLEEQLSDPNPKVPINKTTLTATYQTKRGEYDDMTRLFKSKQEDAKAKYERREAAVLSPIRIDIGNAIQEFTKQKGYAMVLDAAKLDGAGILLGFDEKYDVTKEFITFYNGRQAGTASTATPK